MGVNNFKLQKIPTTIQRSRISKSQKDILELESGNYCIDLSNLRSIDTATLEHIFGRKANLTVDIGFGNGDQLLTLSEQLPIDNFIGIELYKKGIANLIRKIKHNDIKNIKIIYADAKEVLQKFFTDGSIFKVQIFFPDPWPKLRHHKRRLINQDFIEIIKHKLLPTGTLHIATDSDNYANHIIKVMQTFPEFCRLKQPNILRPTTKFETIGLSLKHNIHDIIFVLQSNIEQEKKP